MCISTIFSTLSLFGKLSCYIFCDISNMSMPKIKFSPFVIKSQVSVIYVPTFILNCITSNFFSMMSDIVNLQQVHDFTKVTVSAAVAIHEIATGHFLWFCVWHPIAYQFIPQISRIGLPFLKVYLKVVLRIYYLIFWIFSFSCFLQNLVSFW